MHSRLNRPMGPRRSARINAKALIILATVTVLLAGGAVVAHYVRKRMIADEALATGKAALQRKDWPEACKYLRRYLAKFPDDVEILERYAEANRAIRPRSLQTVGAAIGALRRLLRHRPGDAKLSHELATLHFSIRDFNEAAYVCRQRLAVDPNDADALLCVGRALAAQQKRDEATSTLTQLVETHPDQVRGYVLLSALAVQDGSVSGAAEALKWLDRAVEANPESFGALAERARFHRVVYRNANAAHKDLVALEGMETDDPRELLVAVKEWIEWQEFDQARAFLKRIDQVGPEALVRYDIDPDSLAFARLSTEADLVLKSGDTQACGDLADRALVDLADRQRTRFLPRVVKLYLAAGRLDDAEAHLKAYGKAVSDDPSGGETNDEYVVLSAELANAQKSPYRAINLLVDRQDRLRQNAETLRVLADGFYATGQPGRARQMLEQYVELAPRDSEALLLLAKAYRHLDWDRAYQYATTAWRLRPTLGAKLLTLEARLMRAGGRANQPEIARKILEELTELRKRYPQNVGIHVLMAAIISDRGRLDEAIALLEAAIPECEEPLAAEMLLVDLYAQTDRTAEALAMCEQAVNRHDDLAAPRIRLAELQVDSEHAERARATYERAVAELKGDNRREVANAFVRFLLSRKEAKSAVDLLRRLAAEQPNDVEVRLTLLRIPQARKDPADAQRLIDEIRGIEGSGGVRWKLEQARLWLNADDWRARHDDIKALLDDCLQSDPGWEAAVIVLGALHQASGQLGEAEKAYRLALAHHPNAFGVADRLVDLLKRQTRYIEAQEVLDGIPRASPALNVHRIDLAIGRGEYGKAIQGLELFVAAHPDDAPSRVRLARLLYVVKRDAKRAFKLLEEAAALAPDSIEVLFARVSVLRAEKRGDEAIALLNAEVDRLGTFPVYWLRATYYTAIGSYALAEKDYQRLTTMEGEEPAGYGLLGNFYFARRRTDEAIKVWEAGLEIQPGHSALRRALMKGLVASKDPALQKRGREMLAALRLDFPNDPELLRVEALVLLAERTPESTARAIPLLERCVSINPGAEIAHKILIRLAMERGDYAAAQSLVSRALASNPASAGLKFSRIAVALALKDRSVARELARKLLDQHRRDPAMCNRLADVFRRAKDYEFASVCNAAALAAAPDNELANVMRAAILLSQGNVEPARSHLEAFVRTDAGSRSVTAWLALAERHIADANFDAARDVLARAHELAPDDPRVAVERIQSLAAQGRIDDLRRFLETYGADSRKDIPVLLVSANALADTGRDEYRREARTLYTRVKELDPINVAGQLGYAQTCLEMGDVQESIDSLREVLRMKSTDAIALNNLSWILATRRGEAGLKEAATLVEKGLSLYPDDLHLLDTGGYVYLKLKRLDEARRVLEHGLSLAEDEPATQATASLHLAQVLKAMKADSEAVRSRLETARQLDQEHDVLSKEQRAELSRLLSSL